MLQAPITRLIEKLLALTQKPENTGEQGNAMTGSENFFNLDDKATGIHRKLAEGMTTRIFVGDQSMLSVVEMEPHAEGTVHSHPQEQWGVLLKGSGTRLQGGKEHPVQKGDFWRTPGRVSHGFTAGADGTKVLDVFSLPQDEYRIAGSGITAE